MAIIKREIIQDWFRKGKYPKQEHFWDWLDSFWHKEDDQIPMHMVDQLPEALNRKYNQTDGEELERRMGEAEDRLDDHDTHIANIYEGLADHEERLEIHEERLDKHDERLEGHDKALAEHGEILKDHEERIMSAEESMVDHEKQIQLIDTSIKSFSTIGSGNVITSIEHKEDGRTLIATKGNTFVDIASEQTITGKKNFESLYIKGAEGLTADTINSALVDKIYSISDLSDYQYRVIGLINLDNSQTTRYASFYGKLYLSRFNGNISPYVADIVMNKGYNSENLRHTILLKGDNKFCVACTFTYNGIKYGGIAIRTDSMYNSAGQNYLIGQLAGISVPVVVDYYNRQTNTILNQEIYDSLVDYGDDCIPVSTSLSSGLYVRGNISPLISGSIFDLGTPTHRWNKIYTSHSLIVATDKTTYNDGKRGTLISPGAINLSHSTTPYIDFHYQDAVDSTSRIIEAYAGTLSIPKQLYIGGTQNGNQQEVLFVNGASTFTQRPIVEGEKVALMSDITSNPATSETKIYSFNILYTFNSAVDMVVAGCQINGRSTPNSNIVNAGFKSTIVNTEEDVAIEVSYDSTYFCMLFRARVYSTNVYIPAVSANIARTSNLDSAYERSALVFANGFDKGFAGVHQYACGIRFTSSQSSNTDNRRITFVGILNQSWLTA